MFAIGSMLAGFTLQAADEAEPQVPEVRGEKFAGVYRGQVEIWASPTHKQAAGNFRNGLPDGQWIFWDSGGTKIAEFNYRAGTFSGAVKFYFNTDDGPKWRGKMKFRGSFLDGEWEGSVMSYYPDGRNRTERVYRDGVVADAYAYNVNGKAFNAADAMKIALEDEAIDNAYVDALDAYINKWVK